MLRKALAMWGWVRALLRPAAAAEPVSLGHAFVHDARRSMSAEGGATRRPSMSHVLAQVQQLNIEPAQRAMLTM